MKGKSINFLFGILGLIPLIIWSYDHINVDLWYDEVFSLEHFVLKDIGSTLFYYPLPNNHVFFNLTSFVVSNLMGYKDVFAVAENVHVFRSIQLIVTVLIAYDSFKIVNIFFYQKSSFLIGIILFTTIPFLNFSLQLRGYNMSSLFLVMLIYYSWSYIEQRKKLSSIMIVVSTFLLLYTIPSNAYFFVGFGSVVFFRWLLFRQKEPPEFNKKLLMTLVYMTIGVIITTILYLPILEDIIFNKYSHTEAKGVFYTWEVLLKVVSSLFSKRYALLLLFIPGLYILFKRFGSRDGRYFISLFSLFLISFILSFLHQKIPFSRTFVPLAPIFCILITVPIISLINRNANIYVTRALQFLVTGYCIFIFIKESSANNTIMLDKLSNSNQMQQNLYRNYYLTDLFKQDKAVQLLVSFHKEEAILLYDQYDMISSRMYLRKHKIPFIEVVSLDDLKLKIDELGDALIVTSNKYNVIEELKTDQDLEVEPVTKEYLFMNTIHVKAKSNKKPLN